MLKYTEESTSFTESIRNPETQPYKVCRLVGPGKRVLEIGCAAGYMSRYLTEEMGCRVTGVEIDEEAAQIARRFCGKVIIGDIEDQGLLEHLEDTFEVIIVADVLEHLARPQALLTQLKGLLEPEGYAVVSIPNVAFWEVRKNLLSGRFDYEEIGILDQTHLRFYTMKTARELVEVSGYHVEVMDVSTWKIPFEKKFKRLPWFRENLSMVRQYLGRKKPTLFGYQFIMKIVPLEENRRL